MKLYIKQQLISARDIFYVKDENGNDKYEVREKDGIRVGLQQYIYDMNGKELAYISQKGLSLNPTFRVYTNGTQIATIVKKFTLFKPRYVVDELGWTISGDFTAHEYTISDSTGDIIRISKEWLSWGDSFVIDFARNANEIVALAVVLAIDCIVDQEEEHRRDNR